MGGGGGLKHIFKQKIPQALTHPGAYCKSKSVGFFFPLPSSPLPRLFFQLLIVFPGQI